MPRQRSLPLLAFCSGIQHIVLPANYENLRHQESAGIPGFRIFRWRKNRVVWVGLKGSEIEGTYVPNVPGFPIVSAVEDMKILRPFENLSLAHSATIPMLTRPIEYGVCPIFRNRRRIACRRSRVADRRLVIEDCTRLPLVVETYEGSRRLTRVDNVDDFTNHRDRWMR